MAKPLDTVEREALALPQRDRATLAEHLLATLDEAEDKDVEAAWLAEAERRYQEYRAGRMRAVPADQVFAHIRAQLSRRNEP
jgi:putative addiction module component (TIGR02574 family)